MSKSKARKAGTNSVLEKRAPAAVQTGMYVDVTHLLRRLGLWFLVNVPVNADLGDTIARYRAGATAGDQGSVAEFPAHITTLAEMAKQTLEQN